MCQWSKAGQDYNSPLHTAFWHQAVMLIKPGQEGRSGHIPCGQREACDRPASDGHFQNKSYHLRLLCKVSSHGTYCKIPLERFKVPSWYEHMTWALTLSTKNLKTWIIPGNETISSWHMQDSRKVYINGHVIGENQNTDIWLE